MSALFTPYSLGPLSLPNRIVIAPMCQYSAQNGEATDWHLMHYGNLALSGAGLLIIEATGVEPAGRITPADLGLWSDACEAALARVLQAVRRYSDMPIAIQLAHAGRKGSCAEPWNGGLWVAPQHGGWQPLAPSPIPFADCDPAPLELDHAAIQRIVQAFVDAAQRAHRLGLDAIEIHSAHGYLLHEFLSPLSNQRSDEYGGSLQNRMRLVLQVYDAVRAAVPDSLPVGVRISATDWVDGGWDLPQSIALAKELQRRGCAFIHVSSGGLSPAQKIPVGANYQVPFAEAIRAATGLPTIAVGLITDPEDAEAIIANGQADMIALARGILFNPRWPWHAAAKLGAKVSAAPQYLRCQPHGLKELFGEVVFKQH